MSAPTPQSGENHTAVLWLIRGSLVLFASFLLLILGLIVAGALAQAAHYFQNPPVHGDPFSSVAPIGGVLVGVGLIIVIPCFLVNWVRRLSRKKAELPRTEGLLKVDANSVSTFAMFFAGLAAHDLYHLMPPLPPHTHLSTGETLLFDRNVLWVICFFILWKLVNIVVIRVLGLEAASPPQAPPPTQPGPILPL